MTEPPASARFELATELAAATRDRHSAWEFIRRFADTWAEPLRDCDGYGIADVHAAEERLGFTLPAALREAYTLFGKRADLCGTMNFLKAPDQLAVFEDLLLYHHENQGAWERYIRPADLHMDDPPTVQSCDWGHGQHACAERLSIALVEMVLTESLYADDTLTMYGELLETEIAEVYHRYTPLPLPPLPLEPLECTPAGGRWYAGENVILNLTTFHMPDEYEHRRGPWGRPWSRGHLNIRARTPDAAQALQRDLPREWFNWRWHKPEDPYPPKP